MKKLLKTLGSVAVVAMLVFGMATLSLTSCDMPGDEEEALTTPVANPKGGTYTSVQSVILTAKPADAKIYYTIDGTDPTTSSSQYTSTIPISTTTTLKAIAVKDGQSSEILSETYTINLPNTVATPVASPAGGTYTSPQSVTLATTTSGAQIRYTTTGIDPTATTGEVYSTAIPINATTTLKAIAVKEGMTSSGVMTATYIIDIGEWPPANATELTISTWANGTIATATGEQWFKFTATATTSYIHFDWDTLKSVKVQMYNSTGTTVGAEATMGGSGLLVYMNASRATTSGEVYYVKVQPTSGSGDYKLGFTASTTPPNNTIPTTPAPTTLTVATWGDGNITVAGGEQWFKFTATSASHYIIFSTVGTLRDVNMQLYDSTGTAVGALQNLYGTSNTTSRTVTSGNEYYIRIRPYSNTNSGTYKIGFNTVNSMPIALPEEGDTTELTSGVWADGEFETSDDENWFRFTASGTSAYFHLEQITSTSVYVQLYRTDGTTVGSSDNIPYLSNNYRQKTSLTNGTTYYVKVTPYSANYVGTYRIAFNTSTTIPSMTMPTTGVTELTAADTYTAGSVSKESWAQWFKFDATAATTYIHFSPDTLTSVGVQMFSDAGVPVGTYTNLTTASPNTNRTTTNGSTYYIRVIPYSYTSSGGNFKLAFNTSTAAPAKDGIPPAGVTPTEITAIDTWISGNIATAGGEQWFKFTPTTTSPYILFEYGTLTSVYIEVYDADGRMMGGKNNLTYATRSTQRTGLTANTEYYIKVTPYSDTGANSSGMYQIGFSTTTAMPWTAPESALVTELTNIATWYDGNVAANSEQWFKFTTTGTTQYLHFSGSATGVAGTLTDVYVRVYRATNGEVYNTYRLYGTGTNAYQNFSPSNNAEYYIRVTPNPVTATGTFKIGFNTGSARPVTP